MKRASPFVVFVVLLACTNESNANRDGAAPDVTKVGDTRSSDGPAKPPEFSISVALASDFQADAPGTVGIVKWSLQGVVPDSAEIHFGLGTDYGMIAPVDLGTPD